MFDQFKAKWCNVNAVIVVCAILLTVSCWVVFSEVTRREKIRIKIIDALQQSETIDELNVLLKDSMNKPMGRGPNAIDEEGRYQSRWAFSEFPHAYLVVIFDKTSRSILSRELELGERTISLNREVVLGGRIAQCTMPYSALVLLMLVLVGRFFSTLNHRLFRIMGVGLEILCTVLILLLLSGPLYVVCLWWL